MDVGLERGWSWTQPMAIAQDDALVENSAPSLSPPKVNTACFWILEALLPTHAVYRWLRIEESYPGSSLDTDHWAHCRWPDL